MTGKVKHTAVCLLFAWVILLCGGCLKDISGEIPNNTPKITVNGFFNSRIPILVSISKSTGILQDGTSYLTPATGYIYENDVLIDSVKCDGLFEYHLSQALHIPQVGKTYRIEVAYPGFDTVSAGSILPDYAPIQSVTLDTVFYPPSGQKTYVLRIKINDNAAENNYYHLMVYRNRLGSNGEWSAEPLCFVSDETIFQSVGKSVCSGATFTDATFNGQEKEIVVNTKRRLNSHLNDSVQFLVELRNGSLPYFQYNKSLTLFKNGQGDIFVQPSPIIGNVKNGYGIFAGYTPSTDTVKLN